MVVVANVGRRPIFVTAAVMQMPKGVGEHTHYLLGESIPGKKLSEGGPPAKFFISNEGMEQYGKV
jgi:hypothetical protein